MNHIKPFKFSSINSPFSDNWPPKPLHIEHLSEIEAQRLYGHIEYVSYHNEDDITIINDFEKENIITIEIPQLARIKKPHNTNQRCHKLAAPSILGVWQEWEDTELLQHILTFNGLYWPRFIRGSRTSLSNHAYGVAFDINRTYNMLGVPPARQGELGSVRELVPIANKWGFYWGGHFEERKDGMHFELANIDSIY